MLIIGFVFQSEYVSITVIFVCVCSLVTHLPWMISRRLSEARLGVEAELPTLSTAHGSRADTTVRAHWPIFL